MVLTRETELKYFKPWAGARDFFNRLTIDEVEKLEEILTDYKKEWDEIELNDVLWFEDEWICEMLGIDHEQFWKREAK